MSVAKLEWRKGIPGGVPWEQGTQAMTIGTVRPKWMPRIASLIRTVCLALLELEGGRGSVILKQVRTPPG